MILERITFLLAIFSTTIFSLIILSNAHPKGIELKLLPILWTGLAGLIIYFFYLLYSPFYHLINKALFFVTSKLPDVIRRLFGYLELSVRFGKREVLFGIFLSFVWQAFFLARVYSLFLSLQIPLNFLDVTWMASLVLLVQHVPISFEGLGVRETAYAYLFKIQGLPPETGALIGILFFSQMLLMSLIGGAFELFSTDQEAVRGGKALS